MNNNYYFDFCDCTRFTIKVTKFGDGFVKDLSQVESFTHLTNSSYM